MSRRPYTTTELAVIRKDYPYCNTRELAKRLKRPEASIRGMAFYLGVKKHPDFTDFEPFMKGQKPWNTGKVHNPEGWRPFQYKPGHRSPSWRPVGTEVGGQHGVLMRKVSDTGKRYADWQKVKDIVWREAHGAIPPRHCVLVLNGDQLDMRIENLAVVSRAMLMQLNAPKTTEAKRKAALNAWGTRRRAGDEARP